MTPFPIDGSMPSLRRREDAVPTRRRRARTRTRRTCSATPAPAPDPARCPAGAPAPAEALRRRVRRRRRADPQRAAARGGRGRGSDGSDEAEARWLEPPRRCATRALLRRVTDAAAEGGEAPRSASTSATSSRSPLLVVAGLVSAYVIVQNQRLRIPLLEERPFELKAEFETAQAVVPGQGQTLRVAGVQVGDVDDVELEDGVAVVTFGVDRDFLPVYKRRDDAAAPDRPASRTCSSRWTRAARTRGRDRGGRHGPAREHGPRRQPRRDPRGARQRHAGLPAAAAGQRRAGPRRARQGPRQACSARSARSTSDSTRSTPRSPSARTTCAD